MTGTARNNRQKDRARWPPRASRESRPATALDLASATRERNLAHPAIQVRTNLSQVRSQYRITVNADGGPVTID
jgi:hypothetical protein